MDHKWHVHVKPEGNDTYAEMGPRCKSLGGHYNPYVVDLAVSIMAQWPQYFVQAKRVYEASPITP